MRQLSLPCCAIKPLLLGLGAHYNATLLSKLLAHKESRGDMQGAALVKQVSPVAWQHVNLYGRYEFRKQPEPVHVDEIVRELAEIRIGTETVLAA
jgi:hypothetical protein